MDVNSKKYGTVKMKEPLNFWGCEKPHLLSDFPHRTVQNIQLLRDATIVNDVSRSIPRISDALEDRQDEHQSTMVDIEGMIVEQPGSVFIYR